MLWYVCDSSAVRVSPGYFACHLIKGLVFARRSEEEKSADFWRKFIYLFLFLFFYQKTEFRWSKKSSRWMMISGWKRNDSLIYIYYQMLLCFFFFFFFIFLTRWLHIPPSSQLFFSASWSKIIDEKKQLSSSSPPKKSVSFGFSYHFSLSFFLWPGKLIFLEDAFFISSLDWSILTYGAQRWGDNLDMCGFCSCCCL